ncbi:MAG TPA: 4-hydroxy-tetrahydrodipicolinate reductase, partial [Planctomycetota bacterium]|nr:4-hydroxy-tetrahydrodipicolinate reductase [Planctomycetota bacterium]
MSAAPLRVAVVGAGGRLGRFALELLREAQGFELVAGYDSRDDWPALVGPSGAQVALEATRAGLGCEHGLALLAAGVRPVIGTSGVSAADGERLDREARRLGLGGLIVPNFSLGSLLLQRFAAEAVRHFPDAEIVELHHERKADAPSGTAAETARRMAAARDATRAQPERPDEPRERGARHGGIPVHSVRLPGLYAHQEVHFGAAGETLVLRHDMSGPQAFGPGILAA